MHYNNKLQKKNTFIAKSIQLAGLCCGLLVATSLLTGCDEENPEPVNEEELITTLTLTFTDSASTSNVFTATFRDTDGDGGNGPTQFDTIMLEAGKTYFTEITLLDESKTPADVVSEEVLEEANDHHFFFHVTGANVGITYEDMDTNSPPLPLGLSTRWIAGSASTGTVQVVLKHQPGVKDGTEVPGETDIDVTFVTKVQ